MGDNKKCFRRAGPCVLQVLPELETGGAERTAIDVCLALKDAGGYPLVASAGGRLVADLTAADIAHIKLPLAAKAPYRMLANAFALSKLVRDHHIDILHARSRAPAWSALLAARMTSCAFVTTYHGAYTQKSKLKGFYNSVMARGDRSIANSHYIADLMRERHKIPEARLAIIHRGADMAAFAPENMTEARKAALLTRWQIPAGTSLILNVARLTPWKGQRVILRALRKLADESPALLGPKAKRMMVFAGDDQGRSGYRAELHQMASDLGLENQVRFVGHVTDIPAALAISDLAVVASIEPEAFGRAAIEAQAAAVPVIVSDLGAVRETVLAPPEVRGEARTGWRVPANDAAALAGAIKDALALSPDNRSALCARARRHVEAAFALHQMTAKTLHVYDDVLASKAPGAL